MDEVVLGVEGMDGFFADAREMARRLDRGDRDKEVGRIVFAGMELLLKVLTPNRWVLLRELRQSGPSSVRALAHRLGRDYRGVHADIAALREAGLAERREDGRVEVPWSKISVEMSLHDAA